MTNQRRALPKTPRFVTSRKHDEKSSPDTREDSSPLVIRNDAKIELPETHRSVSRREFLGVLTATSVGFTLGGPDFSQADTKRYGKLHDSTKCIGCKRCMSACKRWNKLKIDRAEDLTDRDTDLTGNTWTVVNLVRDKKNREDTSYLHWACQHCKNPACEGVCPVSAIKKHSEGPVVINENKCIGCRYCYQACPYKVPRFDFKKRVTRKCTMCNDRISHARPACVAACPEEALDFGLKGEMLKKAKKRTQTVGGYLLGEHEAGGTDFLTILKSKPRDLGLVVAEKKVINETLDKVRITFSGFSGAALLAGLMYAYSGTVGSEKSVSHKTIQTRNTPSPSSYSIWIISLIALMFIGGYALLMSFFVSLEILEFSLQIPWAMLVSSYVFFVVSSTGLCIVSSLGHVFGMKRYELISKRCVFLALITIIFGMTSIGVHLGHPERALIYNVLTPNLQSAMWWMGALYSLYILFIAIEYWLLSRADHAKTANNSTGSKQTIYNLLVLNQNEESPEAIKKDHKWARIIGILALISGLSAHSTLGALFGHLEARSLWYGSYYPIYFLFSAAFCGYAWLLTILIITYKVQRQEMARMLKDLILEMAKIFALLLSIGLLFTSYKLGFGLLDPIKAKSIMLLLNGPFSLPFWLFEFLIGSFLPIVILLYSVKKEKVLGVLIASVMVLVGVFIMRYDFVVAAQVYPIFKGVLPTSFFPTVMEIFVISGIIGAFFFAYTMGVKYLSLKEENH